MFELLLEKAVEIAKKLNEDHIFVISHEFYDIDDFNGVKIYNIPKKFSNYLESMLFSFEKDYDAEKVLGSLIEKSLIAQNILEYVSSLSFLKNIPLSENCIMLIDLESYKGLIVSNQKKSRVNKAIQECSDRINPEVLKAIINIAISVSLKGREGRKIGTAFVIGDVKEVMKRSKQMIINPFEGHPVEVRNIKDPYIWESIMEFAQLDGVFIVDEEGTIISAGRYLDVSATNLDLRPGLGTRHLACAAISQETEAISVVVSESGGDITIFKDGKELLRISGILF
ncbi:hypothetical protein Asulf_01847 [Archaeoglobus sulfaticallidus PM70-1]|uniref:Diadenylate cyclase n=1 Tax=Archaeoglobus sulfaticallidus PM70-1 TaxID=387631 RepID=N0BMF9_9EURY|nr:diadenylate cyclase [Archaeoglobus sulfaticallidus]AGK61816.1 hypothetical protein Asulf_01847 [Archaeoglobus sulfaticallidus PM70-1]